MGRRRLQLELQFLALLFLLVISGSFSQECNETFEKYMGYKIKPQRSGQYKDVGTNEPPLSKPLLICSGFCESNSSCGAAFLEPNGMGFSCELYDKSVPTDGTEFIENYLEKAERSFTLRKICLPVTLPDCSQVSSKSLFDVSPGWGLDTSRATRFQHVTSMQRCQELCLEESGFICRSVTYNSLSRNCMLSQHDRRSAPGAFTDRNSREVYIENQCTPKPSMDCKFNLMTGQAMDYVWHTERLIESDAMCQRFCLEFDLYICRGYQYDADREYCSITSEDTFSMRAIGGNGTVQDYFQVGECVDVAVMCTMDSLVADFKLNREFSGRVFSMANPQNCMFDLAGKFEFNITLGLSAVDRQNCGIVEDGATNSISTVMMLQYHDMVKTGMDRMFKLMCTFEMARQSVENSIELKKPAPTPTPRVVQGGGPLPEAFMRIVNGEGQRVSTAEINQRLYAEVVLRGEGAQEYGVFVTSCDAFGDGRTMLLVDSFGCPTDTSIFEGFSPVPNSEGRILRAAFTGFRFNALDKVNINCDVNFCFQFCEPALCTDKNGRRIQSYGRKKREIISRIVATRGVEGELTVSGFERNYLRNISSVPYSSREISTLPLGYIHLSLALSLSIIAIVLVGGLIFLGVLIKRKWRLRKGVIPIQDKRKKEDDPPSICLTGFRFFSSY